MIDRDMHQVALPPGTDKSVIDHVVKMIEPRQRRVSNWTKVRLVTAKVLHPIGMHYWVTWNTYDASSDSLLVMGLTCMFCPRGRVR